MTNDTARNADTASLSPEGFSRWPDVERLTGLGRETVRIREKAGTFPLRTAIGVRTVAWRNNELLQWLRDPLNWRADTKCAEAETTGGA